MVSEYKQLFEKMLAEVITIQGLDTDKAVSVASILVQEYGKNKRAEMIQEARANNGYNNGYNKINQRPTPKQFAYMRQLGIEIPKGLTRQEASNLIDEAENK